MATPLTLMFVVLLTLTTSAASGSLSPNDRRQIRATFEAYRTAWLRNDSKAVLATFSADAVIMPHHGGEPSIGLPAIQEYWFSPGPKTTITSFDVVIDEVDGAGRMAFLRGRSKLRWTVEAAGGVEHWSNAGTFMNVMIKTRDGRWLTRLQMWDDPPNRRDDATP